MAVEMSWPIGYPRVRKLDTDLWEVRTNISDNRICRVLFTISGKKMILLHGFIKKSQKTPKDDLDLGKKKKKPGFRREEMNKEYVGSSFDDFLKEEKIAVEVKNEAIKRLISYNLLDEMKKQNINKTEMAKRMSTSRAALDRLLNPYNDSVTLATLTKAANVLGKKLVLQLQ